jgi:hypothetical protein
LPDKKNKTHAHLVLDINSLANGNYLCKQSKMPLRISKNNVNVITFESGDVKGGEHELA